MKWLGVTVLCLGLALSAQAQQASRPPILASLDQPDQLAHPDRVKVNVSALPSIGGDSAPITIVEFTDLECPYCAKFHSETYRKIRQAFVDKGKVRFVHWDLPLATHSHALFAAEAARCAGEQGHFWAMRDWMGSNPDQLDLEHLRGHAIDMRLDVELFRWCLATAQYRNAIKADVEGARNLHINGTPSFVIGKTAAIVDGEVMIGALPYEVFEAKLTALSRRLRSQEGVSTNPTTTPRHD